MTWQSRDWHSRLELHGGSLKKSIIVNQFPKPSSFSGKWICHKIWLSLWNICRYWFSDWLISCEWLSTSHIRRFTESLGIQINVTVPLCIFIYIVREVPGSFPGQAPICYWCRSLYTANERKYILPHSLEWYRKGTSIRQAPVFRHLRALRKTPWKFIIWMNEL